MAFEPTFDLPDDALIRRMRDEVDVSSEHGLPAANARVLGESLGEVYRESLRRYEFARKANFDASCRIIEDIQLYVLALRGMGSEALRGGTGNGWSARTLRLIQRFRKSVHEAR